MASSARCRCADFSPFVALEDREAGVLWGAQIACPGSWQMEVFRKDDFVALSDGQADREFGHWFKTLKAGETYGTPVATIVCIKGYIDQLAQRLSSAQEGSLTNLPQTENELPIVLNEWCTSWGNPTQENPLALAKRLQGTPAKHLVIDDGWAERPGGSIQQNGDWNINRKAFPDGLAGTCQAIRDRHSTFHDERGKSWCHPQGWQAVLRTSKNGKRAVLVAHTFGKAFPKSVHIPLAESGWKIEETWPEKQGLPTKLKGKSLQLDLVGEFRACIVSLSRA